MNHSYVGSTGATSDWPTKFRARFWSHGGLPYRVAAVQFTVSLFKAPANVIAATGILLAGAGIGIAISAFLAFPPGWPLYPLAGVAIVIAGTVSGILTSPRRTQIYNRYRPGTESRIVIAKGEILFSLNGHVLRAPVSSVTKVWKFGELSAIQFADARSVVIPTAFLPQRKPTDQNRKLISRWERPGA